MPVSAGTCQSVAEVVAMLTDLNLPGLFAVDPATADKSSVLTAEILFDPIEKARLEEIRSGSPRTTGPLRRMRPVWAPVCPRRAPPARVCSTGYSSNTQRELRSPRLGNKPCHLNPSS